MIRRIVVSAVLLAVVIGPLISAVAVGSGYADRIRSRELAGSDAVAEDKSVQDDANEDTLTYEQIWARLQTAVAAGDLTSDQAIAAMAAIKNGADAAAVEESLDLAAIWRELLAQVESGEMSMEMAERKMAGLKRELGLASGSGETGIELDADSLPSTSTGTDVEGPGSTFIFGWAANATHRFMDNSHRGEPRTIRGVSFRLDHRDHRAIGRSWSDVTVRVAHGDWHSINYNRSTDFELVDEPVTVFDQPWSFPALDGFPPLRPATWGGVQNSLTFRFSEPWEYNGEDAIFLEFRFEGGVADDGREWSGETPKGFEYFLDSMPEIGGWRTPEGGRENGVLIAPARVETATSYTAGGQSVWTSADKGLPFIRYDE